MSLKRYFVWHIDIWKSSACKHNPEKKNRIIMHFLHTFYPSSTILWHRFRRQILWTYVQATSGRTSIHPQDVRPYTLRTYVHTPFERTSTHPWTYVHRKAMGQNGKIRPKIAVFSPSENRIFAHEEVSCWFHRILRGYRKSKKLRIIANVCQYITSLFPDPIA